MHWTGSNQRDKARVLCWPACLELSPRKNTHPFRNIFTHWYERKYSRLLQLCTPFSCLASQCLYFERVSCTLKIRIMKKVIRAHKRLSYRSLLMVISALLSVLFEEKKGQIWTIAQEWMRLWQFLDNENSENLPSSKRICVSGVTEGTGIY